MSNTPQQRSSSASTSSQQTSLQQHFTSLAPPPLSAHLSDSAGHTILSTAESQSQTRYFESLTNAYLQTNDIASRMGLGTHLRVTMTTGDCRTIIQTASETEGGETIIGTVVAPEARAAEALLASYGITEVGKKVGQVLFEARPTQ